MLLIIRDCPGAGYGMELAEAVQILDTTMDCVIIIKHHIGQ